jgi:ABC-2 type transport system permease protein
MAVTPHPAAAPGARMAGWRAFAVNVRTAAWLGWKVEANWADPMTFLIYTVARPLALALILAGMYWAVAGGAPQKETFILFWVANAFHEYVTRMVVAMGWVVVDDREQYETLKQIVTAPIGMFTYLWGRTLIKFAQATLSMVLVLAMGWWLLGLTWEWSDVRWGPLALALALGLVAVVHCGFLVSGCALLLPQAAMSINESVGISLYLLAGVIFPIDLLPAWLQNVTMALPFTWWYEALRRFIIGHGASERLAAWPDSGLLAMLAVTTLLFSLAARRAYRVAELRARKLGRIDQATLF